MTRWLEAAQRASDARTKPTKLTKPLHREVLSVKSVLSEGVRADPVPDEPEAQARDLYEERAAIRQFDGGQDRETAERAAWIEAPRATGVTALDDWRAVADDPHNPDTWKDQP